MLFWLKLIFKVIMYLIAGHYVLKYFWPLGGLAWWQDVLVAILWPIVATYIILPFWVFLLLFISGVSIKLRSL